MRLFLKEFSKRTFDENQYTSASCDSGIFVSGNRTSTISIFTLYVHINITKYF